MKNILVIGSNGMLGYAVTEYFSRNGYNVRAICRADYDIAKDPIEKFGLFLDGIEVVINCAGVIKPMIAKNTIEDVIRVNSIFPRNLAKLCDRNNIKCFHITTDCVYSGKKGMYTEEDFFDADDLYGMSKNAGENCDCMVLRTSIIGEEKGPGRSLLSWAKSQAGKEVNGFSNHQWNGVTTLYLAEIIEKIILGNHYKKGICHIYSPNTVTKFELLEMFNTIYNLDLRINNVEAKEVCNRSLSSTGELSQIVSLKSLENQISQMKSFFQTPLYKA